MEPLLLRAGEVAKLLGLGRSKVFAMLAAGELPVMRIGRSVRVPRAALERWVAERTQEANNPSQDVPPLFAESDSWGLVPEAAQGPLNRDVGRELESSPRQASRRASSRASS
jgi:excisionase family DNA binding protein